MADVFAGWRRCVGVGFRATAVVVVSSLTCASGEGVEVRDLRRIVKDYREGIEDIDFTFEGKAELLGPDPVRKTEGLVPSYSVRIMKAGPMKYMRFVETDPRNGIPSPEVLEKACDGDVVVSYQVCADGRRTKATVGERPSDWRIDHNHVYAFLMWPTLRGERSGDLERLLGGWGAEVLPERETVFGAECVVVEFDGGRTKAWVDDGHGGIPRRIEEYDRPGGLLTKVREVEELCQDNGMYFPGKCVELHYAREDEAPESVGRPVTRFEYQVDPETLRINRGLGREDFQLKFAPGTRVFDHETKTFSWFGGQQPTAAGMGGGSSESVTVAGAEAQALVRSVREQQEQVAAGMRRRRLRRLVIPGALLIILVVVGGGVAYVLSRGREAEGSA